MLFALDLFHVTWPGAMTFLAAFLIVVVVKALTEGKDSP